MRAICAAEAPLVDLSGRTLGLGLWAVDHERGELVNWVSSDRAYQEPDSAILSSMKLDASASGFCSHSGRRVGSGAHTSGRTRSADSLAAE